MLREIGAHILSYVQMRTKVAAVKLHLRSFMQPRGCYRRHWGRNWIIDGMGVWAIEFLASLWGCHRASACISATATVFELLLRESHLWKWLLNNYFRPLYIVLQTERAVCLPCVLGRIDDWMLRFLRLNVHRVLVVRGSYNGIGYSQPLEKNHEIK